MMADSATENLTDEGRPLPLAPRVGEAERESGFLERSGGSITASDAAASGATEREASLVASAMQLGKDPDAEIEITTDDAEHPGVTNAPADDEAIEVSDDEIETADPNVARATQPSPSSALGAPSSSSLGRSRPPVRPSLRPRAPSSMPLPPPRSGSLPPSGRTGVDPWLLANKTLELSHARARIAELEELVAFREARIIELEENLAKARRKLGELPLQSPVQSPLGATPQRTEGRAAETRASEEAPQITETRPAVNPTAEVSLPAAGAAPGGAPRIRDIDAANEAVEGEDDDAERDSTFDADDELPSEASGTAEDLRQITGIGPRYEAALRKQGITRLSQIAAWSEADVRQVAKALKIPKSRIVKGRWVEVAREVIGTRPASE